MKLVKVFTIEEGSVSGGHYQIIIKDWMSNVVLDVTRPTMKEARQEVSREGYMSIIDERELKKYSY